MKKNTWAGGVVLVALVGSPAMAEPLQVIELPLGFSQRGDALEVVGDVNGDGYVDIAMANLQSVDVYLGTASGPPLEPAMRVSTVPDIVYTEQIVSGDLNGDGLADVVWHHQSDDGWWAEVRYGTLLGLSAAADVVLDDAHGLSVADVDGDGMDDLVVGYPDANADAGQLGVHLGGPTGVGELPDLIVDGVAADDRLGQYVATGDVNGDGYADVLGWPDDGANEVEVYLGSAAGLVSPPLDLPDPFAIFPGWNVAEHAWMTVADLNGDGYGDVVLGSGYYFLGGPAGPPSVSSGRLDDGGAGFLGTVSSLGDVDGSGSERVAFASGDALRISWLDSGVPQVEHLRLTGKGCVGGDVDGDGLNDVLCGGPLGFDGVRLAWGSPGGIDGADAMTWPYHPNPTMGRDVVRLGDLDGDGFEDVVVVGGEHMGVDVARVHRGSPQGLETAPAAMWRATEDLAVGDLNGDGMVDAVMMVPERDELPWVWGDRTIQVRYGDPAGLEAATVVELQPEGPGNLLPVIGDGNGDGYDDLAMLVDNDRLAFFYGGPAGVPTDPDVVASPLRFVPRVWADVNGDGFDDLLLTGEESSPGFVETHVAVAAGGPAGAVSPVHVLSIANQTVEVAVGDWNGDGFDDAAFFTEAVAQVVFGGRSGLDASTAMTPPGDWSARFYDPAPRQDVTGDGIDDLVVDVFGEGLRIYAGATLDFGTTLPDERPVDLECAWKGMAFADVNGDGLAEVVWSCEQRTYDERGFLRVDAPL